MHRNFRSCFRLSRLSFSVSLHVWRTSVWIAYRQEIYCCIGCWPGALLLSYLPVSLLSSKSASNLWKECVSFFLLTLPRHWWRCPARVRICWYYTLPSAFRLQHSCVSLAHCPLGQQYWFLTFWFWSSPLTWSTSQCWQWKWCATLNFPCSCQFRLFSCFFHPVAPNL